MPLYVIGCYVDRSETEGRLSSFSLDEGIWTVEVSKRGSFTEFERNVELRILFLDNHIEMTIIAK